MGVVIIFWCCNFYLQYEEQEEKVLALQVNKFYYSCTSYDARNIKVCLKSIKACIKVQKLRGFR